MLSSDLMSQGIYTSVMQLTLTTNCDRMMLEGAEDITVNIQQQGTNQEGQTGKDCDLRLRYVTHASYTGCVSNITLSFRKKLLQRAG